MLSPFRNLGCCESVEVLSFPPCASRQIGGHPKRANALCNGMNSVRQAPVTKRTPTPTINAPATCSTRRPCLCIQDTDRRIR